MLRGLKNGGFDSGDGDAQDRRLSLVNQRPAVCWRRVFGGDHPLDTLQLFRVELVNIRCSKRLDSWAECEGWDQNAEFKKKYMN